MTAPGLKISDIIRARIGSTSALLLLLKPAFAAVVLSLLTACSPLRVLNALTPHEAERVVKDVPYGALPRQRLDIYGADVSRGSAPVIVFFYGGSWRSGSRSDYEFVGHALAARGITAVLVDYRLYPDVRYPGFLEDAALAIAWTRRNVAQHGGDAQRLFLMGHSAGAYNAAMLALDRRWLAGHDMEPGMLRGWIGLAGPYDFLPIRNRDVQPVFFHPDTPVESQPIHHVTPGAPPALLIAASQDTVVNPGRNTGGLAQRLRLNQVPVEEVYFDRVNHVTLIGTLSAPLRHLAPTLEVIDRFVDSKGPAAHAAR